jgi:hypothetical protein
VRRVNDPWGPRAVALALATWLLLAQQPAGAQGFSQIAFATFTTNVTLTTTSETSLVASGPASAPRDTVNVCVYAWAQLTTGTATTTVTPRIRRGTTTSGTLVGEANAVTIGAAAGSTEQFMAMVCEDRTTVDSVDYNFTLTQASATGNGTALQGGILVLVR